MKLNSIGWAKLDFMITGFSKCGTTTLWTYLYNHPDVYMPKVKEPTALVDLGYENLRDWYNSLFAEAPSESLLGEGTTFYSCAEAFRICSQRIHEFYPQIKLIFLARDPVSRLESSYRQLHDQGDHWGVALSKDINQAIKTQSFIEDTLYLKIYSEFLKHFPKEQTLVLFTEDFKKDPEKIVNKCFHFLGLDPGRAGLEDYSINLNTKHDKHYEDDALRLIRQSGKRMDFSEALLEMSQSSKIQLLPKIGLMHRFKPEDIQWKEETKKWLIEQIGEDNAGFLRMHNRTPECWPRFNEWYQKFK